MAKFLVTGVFGCIGAWVAKALMEQGHAVVGADVSRDKWRLDLVLGSRMASDRRCALSLVQLDIRDAPSIEELCRIHHFDGVIHLAALQLPFCKEDPSRGAQVNVLGTLNFLEIARRFPFRLVYASSTAVYGPSIGRELQEDDHLRPDSLYGVFKRTAEEMARVYAGDFGVNSAGLRPWLVYGPGRDQGLTADVTLALLQAARKEPFHLRFGGEVRMAHAMDVARAFVIAARTPLPGAGIYTLGGQRMRVEEIADLIADRTGTAGLVTHSDVKLPIACETTDSAFQRDFGPFDYLDASHGFDMTLAHWRAEGRL